MVERQPWLDGKPFPVRHACAAEAAAPAADGMSEAVVVGAGPNGLACAATLATRGVGVTVIEAAEAIGGGARTSELTLPGLLHDDCSAVARPRGRLAGAGAARPRPPRARVGLAGGRPLASARRRRGGGDAALDRRDGRRPGRGGQRLAAALRRLLGVLRPAQRGHPQADAEPPPAPPAAARPLRPARGGARPRRWRAPCPPPQARALFGGTAAHAFRPLSSPFSASVGMALTCACHHYGWPVARGGSGAIADALAAVDRASTAAGSRPAGRCARWRSCRPPTRSSSTWRRRAVAEIAGERLPAAGRPRLPPLPPRPGRLQGRPRGRGRRPLGRPELRPGGDRARDRLLRGGRRSPSARSTAAGCRSAPSSSSASSTWRTRRARAATSTRSGPTRTSPTAIRGTRPRRSSTRSNASRPACASGSRRPRPARPSSSRPTTPTTSAATS